ncbi:uncharacterized protein VTP21DRAFT_219 [Calcarisporiella thermophila]|uniref:uncharacterized protein n=1 Tax=Calcarisporiella thermophila TaxID=911321 RepID=UPI00374293DB
MNQKNIDIVVFGATGFTGKFIVEEIARTHSALPRPFSWAIAGRSSERLAAVIDKLPPGVPTPEILIADVNNPESLNAMCSRARLCISAVGPYKLYGEPVVKACVENDCNYVDVTGETYFIELMYAKYFTAAKEKGVTLVNACGFDSIPSDMGVVFAKKTMESIGGKATQIEMYFRAKGGPHGIAANYATYESAIHSFSGLNELGKLRKQIKLPKVPTVGPRLTFHKSPRYDARVGTYTIPFMFADPSVVRHSQRLDLLNIEDNGNDQTHEPPAQFSAYVVVPTFYYFALLLLYGVLFTFLVKFDYGRKLLLKHPRLFTHGVFSREGPTQKQLEDTSFTSRFYVKGFSKDPNHLDRSVTVEVRGPEMGYITTPKCVVQAAYVVLTEKDKVPNGVLTPAAAFAKTSLIERLQQHGLTFEIVEDTKSF